MTQHSDMSSRLDPELVEPLAGFNELTGGGIDLHDVEGTRVMLASTFEAVSAELPPIEGVTSVDRVVPGPDGAPDVAVRVYEPTDRSGVLPALLWLHGGGHVLGSVEQDDLVAKYFAKSASCVVVSVEYRLSPENPFPASVEDCYAALKWLFAHCDEIGVDESRIAIGGVSAGGGLAAGLALLARDRGEVEVVFQLLVYPMLDNRNVEQVSDDIPDTFVWTRENNLMGWEAYLGDPADRGNVSPYAAPSRAADLSGLPPAYIPVGDLDLFLDENADYAQRLVAAGVVTELHVYPGGYHGFDLFGPDAAVSQRFVRDRDDALSRALHESSGSDH